MTYTGAATPHVHIPLPLRPEEDLLERRIEISNLLSATKVTARDRATAEYQFWATLAGPSTEWESREDYLARCFLQSQADQLLIWAIEAGIAPVIADIPSRGHARLDHRIFFGLNKWWSQDTIRSATYRPMNEGCDGKAGLQRGAASGLPLWIKNEDWARVVEQIIHRREEMSGEEFPPERLALRRMLPQLRGAEPGPTATNRTAALTPSWSIYEAVAWIASGDILLVAQQAANYMSVQDPNIAGAVTWIRLEQSLIGKAGLGNATIGADEARERLRAACELGAVEATGIPASRGERTVIPPTHFISVELWPGRGGSLHRVVAGQGEEARWLDLRFAVEDVRTLTGSASSQSLQVAQDVSPNRASGRLLRPPVSSSALRSWIRERNLEGWSQDRIFKGAAKAFPDHEVPGRPEVRKVDGEVRQELELPARKPGRGKKGAAPS
jgi:hypothetical protein